MGEKAGWVGVKAVSGGARADGVPLRVDKKIESAVRLARGSDR